MRFTKLNDRVEVSNFCGSVQDIDRILRSSFLSDTLSFYYVQCGKLLYETDAISSSSPCSAIIRVRGGKGGFGSMLRMIGAQIEKTTNREACRDLSGRRMRDVNNQKKLKDWVEKNADREKEKEERRKARWERKRKAPKHKFEDKLYESQKWQVKDNLEIALEEGLKRARNESVADVRETSSSKHTGEWLGIDLSDESDSNSDSETSERNIEENNDVHCAEEPACSKISSKSHGLGASNEPCHKDSEDKALNIVSPVLDDNSCQHSLILGNTSYHMDQNQLNNAKELHEGRCIQSKMIVAAKGEEPLISASTLPCEKRKTAIQDPNCSEDIDLRAFDSVSELEKVGADCLKVALQNQNLKCGGTLKERATRLFSVKGLKPEEIDKKLFSKLPKKSKKLTFKK